MPNQFVASVIGALKLTKSETTYPYNLARLVDCGGDLSKRWYVIFYIWNLLKREKQRVRIYDVNDFQTFKERKQAADAIIQEINQKLKEGYIIVGEKMELPPVDTPTELTLLGVVARHIEKNKSSLSDSTIKNYNSLLNNLTAWLENNGILQIPFLNFSRPLAERFFHYLKDEKVRPDGSKGIANKTYNNYLTYFQRIYNSLEKKKYITSDENILTGFELKKTKSGSHIPFSASQLQAIEALMKKEGQDQLLLFIKMCYYTFARPRKELRFLKVGDIKDNTIYIRPKNAKEDGRFVIIPDDLNQLIDEAGIRKYPADFYVFGKEGKPGPKFTHRDCFYHKNHRILKKLGFDDEQYTLYGYKHTGNIHLYLATKDLMLVRDQNGHTSVTVTEKYLRKLGLLRAEEAMKQFPKFGEAAAERKIDSSPAADQDCAGAGQE